jgi:archaetidylinositol phosphate synthase
LLNKFRSSLQPIITRLGMAFASTQLPPNFWTSLALVTAVISGVIYMTASPSIGVPWFYASSLGSIVLLISGFLDIVDGSVAIVTKKTSKKGAFFDSIFDKIAEVLIFIGIAIGNLADPLWCMTALSLSLLVSYIRARAESIGIQLKGIGIGERAERLLIVAIIGIIPIPGAMQWAIKIVSIVAAVTFTQRIINTYKTL